MKNQRQSCAPIRHMQLNDSFQLHCPDGPCYLAGSGSQLLLPHVLRVSDVFFMSDDELDPCALLRERMQRQAGDNKSGHKKVLQNFGSQEIDKWGDYELLLLDIPDMHIKAYISEDEKSINWGWYIEGVPPDINMQGRPCLER